ncbi:hypothetical protein COLSTE_00265 [Collinsella stercoris DSM 13279]|uniref:Uncharacterized protein n=1 Tax=Collinsella stercoris DSM 13279 TaxID=445975 RepID=B6G875_9ACTN|nr:hypothetical protein COLSTE_00265 [Collinsella stercoris DSM 13279]
MGCVRTPTLLPASTILLDLPGGREDEESRRAFTDVSLACGHARSVCHVAPRFNVEAPAHSRAAPAREEASHTACHDVPVRSRGGTPPRLLARALRPRTWKHPPSGRSVSDARRPAERMGRARECVRTHF